jgi:NAD(P)-dependent dehydrogenase (short-subunit alcohol dehydrogenase family)
MMKTHLGALDSKQVVIVGASSGIGLATAQAAAAEGAHVTMLSRSIEKLLDAAAQIKGNIQTSAMDMLDAQSVADALSRVSHIDHLVITAVADENQRRGKLIELSSEQLERSLDKMRGFFWVTREAAQRMSPRGSITLTSGASALKPPQSGMSVLAAVNASIIAFGHALALELAPVRVNVITPGVVDTPVWKPEDRERIKTWALSAQLPAQRFAPASDIAHAMLFLMTNPYMTGQNLVVDGGLVAL